ncbi:iron-sulfur protein [Alcaligenes pakistanensis]|uniref:Iron-sulfur protein n=1 Tax=Alcaligenes pakistanensis TaxID=1482717 RepID=A0A8H9IP11_9BURK|nr:PDR/VanB family oxidoreductase [Alcaligenes pakistanensis]MBP6621223.1 oxidoreductase [Alcaligenes sp.]GHC56541.1 iron-sulfur protein [Alcaligenes pakistanensis]
MNAIAEPATPVQAVTTQDGLLSLRIRQIRYEAQGINSYELSCPHGGELPAFEAGAHIDVHIQPGLIRQYSLCNPPHERHRYVIAVLRDANGRGGSRALHDALHVQQIITISPPRNHFQLDPKARRSILLAGGIGITPIKAMAHFLESQGQPFELHYCTRNTDTAAFGTDMAAWQAQGQLHLHLDNGNPEQGLNLKDLLAQAPEGTHVYYCGPAGFMLACSQASAHWPTGSVHCEHFKAPEPAADTHSLPAGAFIAQIASTGQRIDVAPEQTLSDALNQAGVPIATSCVSGLCGTCRVNYLQGEVDHQDYILSPDEQAHCLTACVSRARSGVLVLDL